jgi:hypothetical protein
LDAFFWFFPSHIYMCLSYLIIRPCCPNRCLRVIICAIGTILFHDIELEVSFGESIYFYLFLHGKLVQYLIIISICI